MAEINSEQKKAMQDLWTSVWNFLKKYYNPEPDNDDYWCGLHGEALELSEKYNRNEFLEALMLICIDDIEKREGKAYKDRDLLTKTYNSLMKKRGGA